LAGGKGNLQGHPVYYLGKGPSISFKATLEGGIEGTPRFKQQGGSLKGLRGPLEFGLKPKLKGGFFQKGRLNW